MTESPISRAARLPHLRRDKLAKGDPVPLPLTMASIFNLPGNPAGYSQYGRFDNPTWDAVEEVLSHLEDAPAVAFPSGMAAIAAVFFGLLKSGDRILLPSDGYYTTRVLSERFLKPLGVLVRYAPHQPAYLDGGFDGYRLVFVETPANPGLDICDMAAVASAAHAAGAIVVADNTTMTPYGQRPLDLGADIVVAADTKAPNGHSDALFGHVASRDPDIIAAVREWRKLSGSIPGPFEAWLVHRGLETLEVRFDRMCAIRRDHRAPAEEPPGHSRRPLSRPGRRPVAQSRLRADGALRISHRPDAWLRGRSRGVHRRMRPDPARDVVRRRSYVRRAPRPLGRRRRAGVCPAVGRMRAGRGTLGGDPGVAGRADGP